MRSKFGSILIPFLLLGVLLSPSIGQWVHLAEAHHDERQCTEEKVHFHAEEAFCELNATFTNPHTLAGIKTIVFDEQVEISQDVFTASPNYFFQQINFFHLRGPPQLLNFS